MKGIQNTNTSNFSSVVRIIRFKKTNLNNYYNFDHKFYGRKIYGHKIVALSTHEEIL